MPTKWSCARHAMSCARAYKRHGCRCGDCAEWKQRVRNGHAAYEEKRERLHTAAEAPPGDPADHQPGDMEPGWGSDPGDETDGKETRAVTLTGKTDKRITSMAELFDFFEVPWRWEHGKCVCENTDPADCADRVPHSDEYELISFSVKGNSWDTSMKLGRAGDMSERIEVSTNYQYQVKAYLRPRNALEDRATVEKVWADAKEDFHEYASVTPRVTPRPEVPRVVLKDPKNPQMMELALLDPHLGMLAWGKEVGVPYDLQIGIADYRRAFNSLLAVAEHYSIERICFLVGHDLFHVDSPGIDVKGRSRGGATTAGTTMDFDTRIARLFTHVRRLIVDCIDDATGVAHVDVEIVPGNHDRHTMYKFGEVLQAWYRNDVNVTVHNSASVRSYYRYGANIFMFTHGEEFYRKRDNLVSIFATECPPEMWVKGKVREIHVGHNHINMEKVFTGEPTTTMWEGRATRVRSLPGLTTEDAWHFEEGYKHTRRGTALIWNKSGGLASLHEFLL